MSILTQGVPIDDNIEISIPKTTDLMPLTVLSGDKYNSLRNKQFPSIFCSIL